MFPVTTSNLDFFEETQSVTTTTKTKTCPSGVHTVLGLFLNQQDLTNTKIENIIAKTTHVMMPFLAGTECMSAQLDINSAEVKVCLGDDIVEKTGSDKSVGLHTDLQFGDDREQKKSDSAGGDHPTIVFGVRSTRQAQFVPCSKNAGAQDKWANTIEESQNIDMTNDSIFVLFPDDEKPKKDDGGLNKTKHSVEFRNRGSSVAITFQSCPEMQSF